MKQHELKILPQYFQAVWSGIKTFELRKDDRDYQRGDILVLREWDGEKYTGSAICVKVTYILQDAEKYGLKDGYVIMGIRHLEAACWGCKCEKIEPSRWIPVTERLPEIGKKVLVLAYSNDVLTARMQKQTENGYPVFECNGIFLEMAKPGRITYWMPLPTPPKEETK